MEKKATGIQASFSPKRILFGIDAIECVAAEVKQFGGEKVLMVTDPGVAEAGLVEAITAPLDSDLEGNWSLVSIEEGSSSRRWYP